MLCDGLVLIDLQRGVFDGAKLSPVWRAETLLSTLRALLAAAREAGVPVIFVRHVGEPGHPLEDGTLGGELHPAFAPGLDDLTLSKRTPDAFYGTELDRLLRMVDVTAPAIAGVQTELCVDTTCRRAFALGYEATLVADGHSTWDASGLGAEEIVRHHNRLLGEWFAHVLPAADIEFGPRRPRRRAEHRRKSDAPS